jgi:hypothetical protein
MTLTHLRWLVVMSLVVVAVLFQETWALAGTTGGISGVVTDEKGAPVADAAVRAESASETASTRTDHSGHFVFLSLAPDTYNISIEKDNYSPLSVAGVTVFADQEQTLAFHLQPVLKTIARVTSTAAGALVKAGTTSDVYSVNAATAAKVTGLGGGGGLDNAYSAIATMPGAYVPVGQMGWYQTVYIRGGDYDQVGYEVDGVPVNRSFDNYPSNTATSLGQQEVQVYTGASPADSQGQGLAGYINQVIKTGAYPGYASSDLGIGSPTFYHKANVEVGGATPDRLFSYYVGIGGYNIQSREYDQYDGAAISNGYGAIVAPCPATPTAGVPSCTVDGTYLSGTPGGLQRPGFILAPFVADCFGCQVNDRDNVINFHFGIKHRHDGGRDDVQLLYETSQVWMPFFNSPQLMSSQITAAGLNPAQIAYPTGAIYNGTLNQAVNLGTVGSQFTKYTYPFATGTNLPLTNQDNEEIGDSILKLQYQKNFGSSAYLRIYGYTDYSNWLNYGANSISYALAGLTQDIQVADYVVSSHTRGASAEFADQLSPKDMLQFQLSYTTANSSRVNSYTSYDGPGAQFATLVSSANPDSGICYTPAGSPTGCSSAQGFAPGFVTIGKAFASGAGAFPAITGTCGGAPCEWLATENGYYGEYNNVTPSFSSGALTNNWNPTDRLQINAGVRYDNYTFFPNSTAGGTRNFWFNAWNNSMCYNTAAPGSAAVPLTNVTPTQNAYTGACASELGAGYVQALLSNSDTNNSFTVWQPRVGLTYTINPLNVIRASYGRYDQAPNTAYEQYDTLQQDLPDYLGPTFFGYGRTAPTYPIAPEISNNYDISWEHQFKGTDWSFKLTPFYRRTQNQIEQFYLNVTTNFVSGLNIGTQTNRGVEFELQKGDFARNGFSGLLSFTYTNAYVNYGTLTSGSSVLTAINTNIQGYNAFTSACANGKVAKGLCGSTPTGITAAPCYTPATPATATTPLVPGTPITSAAACTAADVANPYWNAAPQALFSTSGNYWPYDLFPFTPGAGSYSSFVTPYVATLVVNYKHDKWAITPALQFSAGNRYGYPLADEGYNPATCGGVTGVPIGSAYYAPAGGFGNAADPSTCGGAPLYIPDIATGKFDNMGAFLTPSRYTLSLQTEYDISPRISAVLTLANVLDICSGGTSAPWTSNLVGFSPNKVCEYGPSLATEYGYAPGNLSAISPTGAQIAQPEQAYGYYPFTTALPFNAFLDFRLKM